MKKSNESFGIVGFFWLFVFIFVLVFLFIFEPYCVKHHDEWEKEKYDKFNEWYNDVGNDIHW